MHQNEICYFKIISDKQKNLINKVFDWSFLMNLKLTFEYVIEIICMQSKIETLLINESDF